MKEIVCEICNEEMESRVEWVNGRSDSCIVVTPCCNRVATDENIEELKESMEDVFIRTFTKLVELTEELLLSIDEADTTNIKYDAVELLDDLKDTPADAQSDFKEISQFINKTL